MKDKLSSKTLGAVIGLMKGMPVGTVVDSTARSGVKALESGKAPVIQRQAAGASFEISDAAGGKAISLVNYLSYTQAGSGDPHPTDNVRTITGVTSATVTINEDEYTQSFTDDVGAQGVGIGTWRLGLGSLVETAHIFVITAEDVAEVGESTGGYAYAKLSITPRSEGADKIVACSHYPIVTAAAALGVRMTSATQVYIYDESFTSLEAAQEALTGVKIVYTLEEAAEHTVTAQNVMLQQYGNGIETTNGTLELWYGADTKGYVDEGLDEKAENGMVAPVELTNTAAAAHAAGSYLTYNKKVYNVTAAIAIGDTLTVGTNIEELTDGIGGEVSELKSAVDKRVEIKDSDAEDVDLDISDPDGNVILRLADGQIKTKEFDSEDFAEVEDDITDIKSNKNKTPFIKNSSETGVDLDVSDNVGNVIMRLHDGHIKTKEFDSFELAGEISDIQGDIAEIEEAITPAEPTTVTVDSAADLLDEIANGISDIILIKNGTYSVLNVEVTRKVDIVGESRTGVLLECDGTTDLVNPVTDRHGIRFKKGGAMKNLTFSVNDVKYVMHQDNIAQGYDLLIENCTLNRYDDSCGYYFFIGCGCYGTQNIHVKNCSFVFSENTHDRVSYGVYWHNWHLAKSQLNALAANLTIENCGCVGCGIAIVQDLADKDVNDVISIMNCCSTASAPVSSGANGYYLDVPNADVPYNILFIINCKIGDMILQDRSADKYDYLGAVVTNFNT